MRLPRRRFVALLTAAAAGCGGSRGESASTPQKGSRATTTPTEPATRQSVTVGNSHATPEFVTVAVESDGKPLLVESYDVVPGERRTFGEVPAGADAYDVVVETAAGSRSTYRWRPGAELDGLSVTLADGIDFLRTVRCGSDCPLVVTGTTVDRPLIGDGTGRWYAPGRVVLANPGPATEASLAVWLYGESLVDARYRLPRETEVVVPLTFRSGTYRVAVETAAGRVAGDWRVPEEPTRVVDVATLDVGCGPATTELRLRNADDRPHTVRVAVERDGDLQFEGEYTLASGERRAVVPVDASGRYTVRFSLDGGAERTGAWWACPPYGTATVLVDATGTAALQRSGG
jgi:hypothetical protein